MTAQLCKFPQPKKAERPKHWSDSISIAKDYGLKHGYLMTVIEELMPILPENIRIQFTLDDQDGSKFYGCDRGAFVALSLEIGKRAMLALHGAHMRSFRLDIADEEQRALQGRIDHHKSILISALRDFAYFGGGQQILVGIEETFRRAFLRITSWLIMVSLWLTEISMFIESFRSIHPIKPSGRAATVLRSGSTISRMVKTSC